MDHFCGFGGLASNFGQKAKIWLPYARSVFGFAKNWEEGRGYSVDVKMNGVPMRNARADFDISIEDGRTVLTGVMRYEMPFGPIGRAMDRMSAPRMSRLWSGMLAGFKERAETGKDVGPQTVLPLEAVRSA